MLRSSWTPFDWKEDCFICGKSATADTRHPERSQVHTVTTLPIRTKLLECCEKRLDSWASEVKKRLHGCFDLVATEAVYHERCFSRFMLDKELNPPHTATRTQGRPEDKGMLKWFEMLCQWLESEADAELYTLAELHARMALFSGACEIYTIKRLKQKLLEHYKEFIFFSDVAGRSNVVCFRNMAKYIINEKWYSEKKQNVDDEAERIVIAAAKIIRSEIRERRYDTESYPSNDDIENIGLGMEWLPRHLQTLLKTIISSEVKQISIGHSILQSARPRSVITPTMFGLGVEMDHVFGSKWLVNELAHLGFSISYDEVTRYKQSVIQSESLENLLAEYFPGTFTQWVADNVDHNVITLDGQGTFHGMGIIAVSTPKDNVPLISKSRVISRQHRVKVSELVKDKGVSILEYIYPAKKGLSSLIYKPSLHLQAPHTLPSDLNCDLLWHCGWMFSKATQPRPNWSGYMQDVFSDDQHTTVKSEVLLLPIIDLNPSDQSCIYSTLLYIQNQADRLNIQTPCITFDQPLWLKAMEIIKAKSMNIVCRLGGFHTLMSFMGSVGSMMKGSGLAEALEVVYGHNAVNHMISGKAVARALRGHFLVEAALVNKLMLAVAPCHRNEHDPLYQNDDDEFLEMEEPESVTPDAEIYMPISPSSSCIDKETSPGVYMVDSLDEDELERIHVLYKGISDKSIPVSSVADSTELVKLEQCMLKYKAQLSERSPTARLRLQYIEYVETMKLFIRAERTGNWSLHLVAVGKMMNLFAATGHINYAKCSRLYLQMMLELPSDYPWLYECFNTQGFHTVRRSCKYWAGLWTDLTIEQVMMRSINGNGSATVDLQHAQMRCCP